MQNSDFARVEEVQETLQAGFPECFTISKKFVNHTYSSRKEHYFRLSSNLEANVSGFLEIS